MINNSLNLLKRHKPYFKSDHILNIAYNIICGGACLEDIELLRNNLPYMNALGATRIPDPTTAGDFLRRFTTNDVCTFMDVLNEANTKIWDISLDKEQRQLGIIDVDGTIQETYGKCKEGMDMSYNGKWGFAPLVLTEATTGSHLFIVNRFGNKLSQDGAGEWMDKSIKVVKKVFDVVCLRGDSAFSLIGKFDEWTEKKTRFIFGYNAFETLINKAELLEESEWNRLEKPRKNANKVKKSRIEKNREKNDVVIRREYETQRQKDEHVAEFMYRPTKCESDYRVIVLRKKMETTKGQLLLFENYRFFLYYKHM